jgi:hypothetical protein
MKLVHVREPATGVVVMPVRMMLAIDVAKHCGKPYTSMIRGLSNHSTAETQRLAAWDERARLHDVDLALHVRPFNVLIATPEETLDISSGLHQTPDNIIS